ncbi:MAG: sigma-70 family RNA polymerase sigma factor [Anaerolineae bacterium]
MDQGSGCPGEGEKELVDALHRHERCACTQLVERYSNQVFSVALRLTGDPDDAEEVLQDTFVNACKSVDNFEGRSNLGTWLHRIATNSGLMRLRRHELSTISLEGPADKAMEMTRELHIHDVSSDPEIVALTTELRAAMDRAISALPESLRQAFVLREIEGLSTEEAANVLGITPQALKVRIHRARTILRETLASYFTEVPFAPSSLH